MPRFTDRTGEENLSLQGNLMRIIRYDGSHDIDVLFVNTGYIARNKNYKDFTKGLIRDKTIKGHKDITESRNKYITSMLGKVYKHKTIDLTMTVIDYVNDKDISIRFSDGFELHHISSYRVKKGTIQHPNYIGGRHKSTYIGETVKNIQGIIMTIISIRTLSDITIKFEDGTERKVTYARFIEGHVLNPNYDKCISKFEGMEKVLNNGLHVRVKQVLDSTHLLIEFDDKTEKIVTTLTFNRGDIKKPVSSERIKLIGSIYNNWKVVGVNLDGSLKCLCLLCNREYSPISYYDVINNKSRSCNSCSVQNRLRNAGKIIVRDKVGEILVMNNGQSAKFVEYIDYKHQRFIFEDGTEVINRYEKFITGNIANPNFRVTSRTDKPVIVMSGARVKSLDILDFAYQLINPEDKYYYCRCRRCGKEDILSPKQMLEHKC